jgi:D-alanyl-D-alanine carboxypeptidase
MALAVIAAAAPSKTVAAQTQPPVTADVAARIRSYLATQALADTFSGVVVLARHGEIVFSGAYGMASKEYGSSNTLDTRFNLGSINKLMTRIAVEQLVAQHALSYDDTIGKLLPGYPNKAAAAVTVRELLDMSSGIGDFFGPAYEATPMSRLRTLSDYVPLFAAKPLAFAPGTKHAYSNGGFIVLGLMIERASGQDYYSYVQRRIFEPAGMTRSGWFDRDVPASDIASGYTKDVPAGSTAWRNNIYTAPARGSSAGGGYTTAGDLLRFSAALESGKLLDAAGTRSVLGEGIGVAGGAPGINADLEIDPASGYTLVVLSNYDPPSAERVARQIREWIGLD